MVQLHPQEVCQDYGQDRAPVVQLYPQDVCQDCDQDYVPEVRVDHFHPRDVWQDHAQEVRVDHLHLQDVYRDYAQFFPQVDRSHLQSVRDHAHDA